MYIKINAIFVGSTTSLISNKQVSVDLKQTHDNRNQKFELPSFNMVSANLPLKSLSFKGSFEARTISELNDKYLKQIQEAEKELNVLRNPKNNPSLQTAIDENNFYEDFEKNRYDYQNRASRNADRAEDNWKKSHGWWHRQWNSDELEDLKSAEFKSYNDKRNKFYDVENRYDANKAIIFSASQNEEARKARIVDLNQTIDKTKKLIDYGNLQSTINDMLNGKGGLEERIAGYKFAKDQVRKFVENIKNSKENPGSYVQPCVVLYGATGTGKTTFLNAIEAMKLDNVAIVRFNEDSKTAFKIRFKEAVDDAKIRYNQTQQRTILLMDDAEKYFAMSEDDAKSNYSHELNEEEFSRIKKINEAGTNRDVKDFKAILDELSKIPSEEEDNSYKSAMSIFITTNHPNIIDRQLIKRPEKMDAYHIGPAKGEDLKDVVKFYFKDKVSIINKIKMFKDRPDRNAAIEGLSGLTIDAKNSVKELFNQGNADLLSIEPEKVDYESLTEDIQPNEQDGAYSNVMIKKISINAFEKYLENPKNTFTQCFYGEFDNTERDIEPQRYKRYMETANYVNLYKERKEKNLNDEYEFIKMLRDKNKNLLTVDNVNKLNSYINDLRVRNDNLEDKKNIGNISENECIELESLRNELSFVDDPKKVTEYLKTHKPGK